MHTMDTIAQQRPEEDVPEAVDSSRSDATKIVDVGVVTVGSHLCNARRNAKSLCDTRTKDRGHVKRTAMQSSRQSNSRAISSVRSLTLRCLTGSKTIRVETTCYTGSEQSFITTVAGRGLHTTRRSVSTPPWPLHKRFKVATTNAPSEQHSKKRTRHFKKKGQRREDLPSPCA